jgi:hypothetical protein
MGALYVAAVEVAPQRLVEGSAAAATLVGLDPVVRKFSQGLTELQMTFPAISLADADIRALAIANAASGELPSGAQPAD